MGVATPPFGLGLITIKVTQLVYIARVITQPLLLKIAGSAPGMPIWHELISNFERLLA